MYNGSEYFAMGVFCLIVCICHACGKTFAVPKEYMNGPWKKTYLKGRVVYEGMMALGFLLSGISCFCSILTDKSAFLLALATVVTALVYASRHGELLEKKIRRGEDDEECMKKK